MQTSVLVCLCCLPSGRFQRWVSLFNALLKSPIWNDDFQGPHGGRTAGYSPNDQWPDVPKFQILPEFPCNASHALSLNNSSYRMSQKSRTGTIRLRFGVYWMKFWKAANESCPILPCPSSDQRDGRLLLLASTLKSPW